MNRTSKVASQDASTARYHVPNLDRALMILELLARRPHGEGISEMARELALPKNSVFRRTNTFHFELTD